MTDSDPGAIRITRNALYVVSDRQGTIDHEAHAAIHAVLVEAVYAPSNKPVTATRCLLLPDFRSINGHLPDSGSLLHCGLGAGSLSLPQQRRDPAA